MKQLAQYLDQMRLGLAYVGEGKNKADFVIEDMNRCTAEIFSKLQLGQFIPA
jgi:hypothetical protein